MAHCQPDVLDVHSTVLDVCTCSSKNRFVQGIVIASCQAAARCWQRGCSCCICHALHLLLWHSHFHLLPQLTHVTNVVIGSSAERVCICCRQYTQPASIKQHCQYKCFTVVRRQLRVFCALHCKVQRDRSRRLPHQACRISTAN
jgi:hypothetical protein